MKSKEESASEQRRIALIVESDFTVGREILRGIAQYIRRTSRWSIYFEPGTAQHNTMTDWLRHWQGDGIIARIRSRKLARQFVENMKVPVVDLVGDILDPEIPLVQVDNRAIGELAAHHLLEHGYSSFAFCGVHGRMWSKERSTFFQGYLTSVGHTCSTHHLSSGTTRRWFSEEDRERLAQWVAGLEKPIGIMAANDWVGQKLLDACWRTGALVPEEVAVVGVDNDDIICELSNPMLSSIIAGHDRVGFHAAELLDGMMQGKQPPSEPLTVGKPSVVVRRSSDVQTIADRDIVMAIRFIREHACRGIHVDDVASHIAVSRSTLKRRFKQVLSRSVHEEILRIRLERARELLSGTDMTVRHIAHTTGFTHQQYLGEVFKAKFGMTPVQYRKEYAREP